MNLIDDIDIVLRQVYNGRAGRRGGIDPHNFLEAHSDRCRSIGMTELADGLSPTLRCPTWSRRESGEDRQSPHLLRSVTRFKLAPVERRMFIVVDQLFLQPSQLKRLRHLLTWFHLHSVSSVT
jgi:hypothetical protein